MRRTLLTASLLLLAAGCAAQPAATGVASVTQPSAAPTGTAAPAPSMDPQEKARKFAQCMRDNGVDMPDPDPDGKGSLGVLAGKTGGDKEKLRTAMTACRQYSPIKERGELTPQDIEQMRKFAACMRDNGVDMPDPDPSGNLSGVGRAGMNPDDPKFKKAFQTCRDSLPSMGAK
ncbi:hypothetical protein OIE66_31135 [Nonomuraea sp. NBC_01738]|uniref:hypothetical protein n=1 Tax=Nonomuraea sp. NBC_01738 TaxID=2976003 RepID=UPI002E14875C|nr:hypothetical protein OIE66_31135 [Nonomuraea sp. NBC_01738]